jgi:2-oxoisovalerate dehydrogenase E2 component (dihydrolipoyl transacylase)
MTEEVKRTSTTLPGDERIAANQMRRAIARAMTQAWTAPHAHAVVEVDMTAVLAARDRLQPEFESRTGLKLSPAGFVARAAVEALVAVPKVNACWDGDAIIVHHTINLGYAVSIEDGLVVPVIRNAAQLSIAELTKALRSIVDRARTRKLTMDDLSGGTFTLNNTGPLGTVIVLPIVPPGQAAIVTSESIAKRVVVGDDDTPTVRSMMNVVIGFDHRIVDGATAARFLGHMKACLEGVSDQTSIFEV